MESPCRRVGGTPNRRYQPYSRLIHQEVNRVYKKIFATIYGHCIGDALGLLTEGLTREDVKKKYKEVKKKLELVHKKLNVNVHQRKWETGDWTDESDQMILLMISVVQCKGKIDVIDIAKRLIDWSEYGFPELDDVTGHGLCPYMKAVLAQPQFSEDPLKAAEIVWRDSSQLLPSNSAVSHVAFLGLHHYDNLGKVVSNTIKVCKVTHPDIRCQCSCVAVTVCLALLMQNNQRHRKKSGALDIESVIKEAFSMTSNMLTLSQQVAELQHYMFPRSLKDLNLDEGGKASYTYKTLGAGMWALRQNDFRQAVQEIVLEGGDADANAAVSGALLGCKLGMEAIPPSWLEGLCHRAWLDSVLDRYFDILEGKHVKKETTL